MGVVGWSPQIRDAIYSGINPFIPVILDQFNLEMGLLFINPPKITNSIKEEAVTGYVNHYQQVWDIVNLDMSILENIKDQSKPAFIVWGQDDGVFNVRGKAPLDQKYQNNYSSVISDAAHLVMLEKPVEIADLYIKFLRSNH